MVAMPQNKSYNRYIPLFVAILLLVIAARAFAQQQQMQLDVDEVWAIWMTEGTPQEIIARTPDDWPPLYFLIMGFWQRVAGITELAMRYLAVLIFTFGSAAMYRVLKKLSGEVWAGLLGTAAYAALGYIIYLSSHVKAYSLAVSLLPLALLLTLRYFERPNIRRGVILGVLLAAMIYNYLPTAMAFVMLGICTIILYPRKIWRWWLPVGVLFLLAIPLIRHFLGQVVSRTSITSNFVMLPFFEALGDLFSRYTGDPFIVWIVLFGIAAAALAIRQRPFQRKALILLAWAIAGPILLYIFNAYLGFFSVRYSYWVMFGLAGWIGWGLAYLPRPGRYAALLVLVVLMFNPIPIRRYWAGVGVPPMDTSMRWLKEHITPEDVVVIDPNNQIPMLAWDYYTAVYFPDGLEFVSNPADHRRVWYAQWDSQQDPTLEAAVHEGRIESIFVGPPELLIRLYEGPPDADGILYENGMRYHGMEIIDASRNSSGLPLAQEGDPVKVRLWWSVDESPDTDYSISTRIVDETGGIFAQFDGPPQTINGPSETSQWQPGSFYIEERELAMPEQVFPQEFAITMILYQWWDNTAIPAPGVDDNNQLILNELFVEHY